MSARKTPFIVGEWYHCYSRGIAKQNVFLDKADYKRFLETAYLTNQTEKVNLGDMIGPDRNTVWEKIRGEPLVAIGAYCLMPNHFHLLFKEITPNGISTFMQRFGTAYTMYFNKKYERSGGLFTKPFRSKHVSNDRYLRWLVKYIHMNPEELLERCATKELDLSIEATPRYLRLQDYPYSSFPDYRGIPRVERKILDTEAVYFLFKIEASPRF